MSETAERDFAVTAMRYPGNAQAALTYERILRKWRRRHSAGDSLYRIQLDGAPVLAVVSWSTNAKDASALASLPWGDGEPVVLPVEVCQQLARRSLEACPRRPNTIRRVHHGPTGAVLRDREYPAR